VSGRVITYGALGTALAPAHLLRQLNDDAA